MSQSHSVHKDSTALSPPHNGEGFLWAQRQASSPLVTVKQMLAGPDPVPDEYMGLQRLEGLNKNHGES